jgi:ABC-2 type transport system ATP-binding protein
VMDEAERCDDLLLLRDGRLLTQDSPKALMERTGTDRMDAAFLRLIADAA